MISKGFARGLYIGNSQVSKLSLLGQFEGKKISRCTWVLSNNAQRSSLNFQQQCISFDLEGISHIFISTPYLRLKNSKSTKLTGPFRIFQHPLLQNIKKLKRDPLVEFFSRKKSHKAEKLKEGTHQSLPLLYVTRKKEKPFWFSSLSQMMQFGTIKFHITFRNYFGQFVWIEKKSHYISRVSLHEALTKN